MSLEYDKDLKRAQTTKELDVEYQYDYTLPRGGWGCKVRVLLNVERFECTEQFFRPNPVLGTEVEEDPITETLVAGFIRNCGEYDHGVDVLRLIYSYIQRRYPMISCIPSIDGGLHEVLHRSIMHCEAGIREEVCKHIVFSGGNSNFPGLAERLEKEMKLLLPERYTKEMSFLSTSYDGYRAWIGGSLLTGIPSFEGAWITSDKYEDHGADIVHHKCSQEQIAKYVCEYAI